MKKESGPKMNVFKPSTNNSTTNNVVLILLLLSILLICRANCVRMNSNTYFINFDPTTSRKFDGIGALSGGGGTSRLLFNYPEPQRSDILDILFKPNAGASLQILKVEIGGDAQSTEATEASHMHTRDDLNFERGYEWWLLKEAKMRNPAIRTYGLSWGVPGWIGNGSYYSQDNIDYHIKWVQGAKTVYGIDIDFVGIWNEHPYNTSWIKLYRKSLDSAGFSNTKIIAADDAGWDICDSAMQDKDLFDAMYAAGSHYPFSYKMGPAPKEFQNTLKPMWASECWDLGVVGDWNGAGKLAQMLNGNYLWGNMTASIIWNLIYSWYSILPYSIPNYPPGSVGGSGHSLMYAPEPWTGHYSIQPPIYVVAHTTQFAKVGWQYISTSNGGYFNSNNNKDGSFVVLADKSDTRRIILEWSLIIETIDSTQSKIVNFKLEGLNVINPNFLSIWKTNETAWFEKLSPLTIIDNSFVVNLEPRSVYTITTTSGQSKAKQGRSVPSSAPFPFPYADDFETYKPEGTVRYFEDEGGSFNAAVAPDSTRGKLSFKQVVTRPPISWNARNPPIKWMEPEPVSILGDWKNWTNYRVRTDVYLPSSSNFTGAIYVAIYGRIQTYYTFDNSWMPGYGLQIYPQTSTWQIVKGTSDKQNAPKIIVAQGAMSPSNSLKFNQWYTLELHFGTEGSITGFFNSQMIPGAKINDNTFTNGLIGLGSGWNQVYFDNFYVGPF